MIGGYLTEHRCLFGFGLFMNIAGMIGEFVTPLFIGMVIDAIVAKDWDRVNTLIWQWMIFNGVGSVM